MRANHLISEIAFPRTYLVAGLYFIKEGEAGKAQRKKQTNKQTDLLRFYIEELNQ